MKTRLLIASLFSISCLGAFGQQVENDDMYFNSKDREKLKEARVSQVAYASEKKASKIKKIEEAEEISVNPTDSYSARNINPEFAARSNAATALDDNQDYFVQNYRYQNSNDLNSWNNGFNNWYGNSWYNSSYYSPNIYGWNSPYYGGYYSTTWAIIGIMDGVQVITTVVLIIPGVLLLTTTHTGIPHITATVDTGIVTQL
jgi:hypothetical protein